MRDLIRTRKKLVEELVSEKNRVHKVLEDAHIKLSSVVSRVFGVSSLNMIGVLLEKEELSTGAIAELAKGKLKKKVDLLAKTLDGYVTNHHRFLLSSILPQSISSRTDKGLR